MLIKIKVDNTPNDFGSGCGSFFLESTKKFGYNTTQRLLQSKQNKFKKI